MKTHWYMKHPIIFGILFPALGLQAASLITILFQLLLFAIMGNAMLKYTDLPEILFGLARVLTGLGLILIMKPRLWKGFRIGFSSERISLSMKLTAFAIFVIISNIIENGVDGGLPLADTPAGILSGIFQGIGPGFYEEVACRGVVLSLMMYCFHKREDRIVRSVVLSGLCFGILHLINLLSADTVMTLIQVCYATALGIFFGGIYVRTRNLWGPVIFHALIDIAEFIYIGDSGLTAYAIVSAIAITIVYGALGLYFIRPQKRGEIEELWAEAKPETGEPEADDNMGEKMETEVEGET